MRCTLTGGTLTTDAGSPPVRVDVDVARIAALNSLPAEVLVGVPGVRGYATDGFTSGLVIVPVGTDVNVSFVATKPEARGRGLATAVTSAALRDARDRGFATASLQSTPTAEGVYERLGFRPVTRIQEWLTRCGSTSAPAMRHDHRAQRHIGHTERRHSPPVAST